MPTRRRQGLGGVVELSDLEYSLIYAELDPAVWSVLVVADVNEGAVGIPSGVLTDTAEEAGAGAAGATGATGATGEMELIF